jgi:hypothetical protein
MITDRLRSYGAAKAEVLPGVDHLQQQYQNNRAENSHQPTRLRERVMRRSSHRATQRFLSTFGIINSHFRVGRHFSTASSYREMWNDRFTVLQLVVESEGNSLVRLLADEQFVPSLPTLMILLYSLVKLTIPTGLISSGKAEHANYLQFPININGAQ